MRVSLIVAVYKDVEALSLIVEALKTQTYKNFEVIIAEDGESSEMKEFVSSVDGLDIKHTTQEDIGIRKSRSVNNAILSSDGEYLIFIDGDCIPYSTFIEGHVKMAEDGYVLSGRRVNLGPNYAKKLRSRVLSPLKLEKSFLLRYPFIAKDCVEGHSEEGFRVSIDGLVYKLFLKNRKSSKSILGCNYSCFKKDMVAINGYDEELDGSALGTDTDLEWRFKAMGLKLKSVKFIANMFHLYHKTNPDFYTTEQEALSKMQENMKQNRFFCKVGIGRDRL